MRSGRWSNEVSAAVALVALLALAAALYWLEPNAEPDAVTGASATGAQAASKDRSAHAPEGGDPFSTDPGSRAGGGSAVPVLEIPSPEGEPPGGAPIVRVRHGSHVAVRDAPGGELVAKLGDETEFGSPSVLLVRRQRDGWLGVPTELLPNGELGWIRADRRKLRAGLVEHSVVVDISARSAQLFRGERPLRLWQVTVGAEGSETPTGAFAVTDTFRGDLHPAYGCCAVALTATQPNLVSGWQGGNRIAFHGTDGEVGVAASLGCVRSADRDVSALVRLLPLGTPVTIRE